VGLVGESGSGKSVTSLAIMRLLPPRQSRVTNGSVLLEGQDLLALSEHQMEDVRGDRMAMIFQEPMTSLNPSMTVGEQIAEVVRRHRHASRPRAHAVAVEMLDRVGIPDAVRRARQYPHEFSGGMRQRVMIAIAMACEPQILVADEPTTALDVTIQAQILDLMRDMARDLGLAMLFVTHDLGVVAELCDRVLVMYAGQIVESRRADDIFAHPEHPYTHGLLESTALERADGGRLWTIPGAPPMPGSVPTGCRFRTRCPHQVDACAADVPDLVQDPRGGLCRCIRQGELELTVHG
jgi:peptide/nickel transport system ATP-binding protein